LSGALSPGPLLVVTVDSSLRRGWSGGVLTVFGHLIVEVPLIIALAYGIGNAINTESVKMSVTLIGGCTLLALGSYTAYTSRTPRRARLLETLSASSTSVHAERSFSWRPIFSGLIATTTNPFFWIWWATIGLTMLTYASLFVMANVNPPIYWGTLSLLFNTLLSPLLWQPSYLLYSFIFSSILPQFMFQSIDFNYLFLGSTLIGWGIIAIGHFSSDIAWYTSVSLAVARGKQLLSAKLYQAFTFVCGLILILLGIWFLVSFISPSLTS